VGRRRVPSAWSDGWWAAAPGGGRNADTPSPLFSQRLSVVATDAALAAAALWAVAGAKPASARGVAFALIVCRCERGRVESGGGGTTAAPPHPVSPPLSSPGLLILDHIHFQYNGWLCGLLLASVAAASRGRDAAAATLFAALVCAKHLFASLGPWFAVYLLARAAALGWARGAASLAASAAGVAAVVAASFAPFASTLPAMLSRLFPFDRGLLHAYWAGNAWALYAAADVAACAVAKRVARGAGAAAPASGLAAGLVGPAQFGLLPAPGPALAAALVVAAQAPALAAAAARPRPASVAAAASYCLLSAFMFGYHVHEKAVVPAILLAALGAGANEQGARSYLRVALPGLHGLLPLLPPAERAVGGALLLAHAAACDAWLPGGLGREGRRVAAALAAVELASTVAHPLLLAPRVPFAPLAATSVAVAAGLAWAWGAGAAEQWRGARFRGGARGAAAPARRAAKRAA